MKLQSIVIVLALMVAACDPGGEELLAGGVVVKGGMDETGPYDVVPNWLKPAKTHDDTWTWGSVAAVVADNPNRIVVLTRGDTRRTPDPNNPGERRRQNYIVVVDRDGNEIENWSQWDTMMGAPHSMEISPYDPERHIWIIDDGRHQIWKFTNDGSRLVRTWGVANVTGADREHFNGVTSIAFFPDGSFVATDGQYGKRVVKFDANGEYLMEWGGGSIPFNKTTSVAIDAQRRVIVADGDNSRFQIFTENGEFIEEWPDLRRINIVYVDAEQDVWVVDGRTMHGRILKFNLDGVLQDYWGVGGGVCGPPGPPPGPDCAEGALANPHGMSVDSEGNLYLADYNNHRVQKFVPKPGADPARLVGQRARN